MLQHEVCALSDIALWHDHRFIAEAVEPEEDAREGSLGLRPVLAAFGVGLVDLPPRRKDEDAGVVAARLGGGEQVRRRRPSRIEAVDNAAVEEDPAGLRRPGVELGDVAPHAELAAGGVVVPGHGAAAGGHLLGDHPAMSFLDDELAEALQMADEGGLADPWAAGEDEEI